MSDKSKQLKERVAPGLWIDQEDNLHFSIPELLDHFELPHTEENFERIKEICEEVIRQKNLSPIIIYRDKP